MGEKTVQTAGCEQLGGFVPMFAHLNDDVLFGEMWNENASNEWCEPVSDEEYGKLSF